MGAGKQLAKRKKCADLRQKSGCSERANVDWTMLTSNVNVSHYKINE